MLVSFVMVCEMVVKMVGNMLAVSAGSACF